MAGQSQSERTSSRGPIAVRELERGDLDEVVRIDALHSGEHKPGYWSRVLDEFLGRESGKCVGLAAEEAGRLVAYLLGEVRAFEFGSDPCGWIFAVGVDPRRARAGAASALLEEACNRLHRAGVKRVRTMVRRNDVGVLSFFRANAFVGGSFVQLERDLEDRT